VGAGNWQGGGGGFSLPPRYGDLGPSGKNVYHDGYQLDATQLTFVRGPSGIVLAEDAAGSVAASTAGSIDARLLTRLAAEGKQNQRVDTGAVHPCAVVQEGRPPPSWPESVAPLPSRWRTTLRVP
jgi:hypothetical protein